MIRLATRGPFLLAVAVPLILLALLVVVVGVLSLSLSGDRREHALAVQLTAIQFVGVLLGLPADAPGLPPA